MSCQKSEKFPKSTSAPAAIEGAPHFKYRCTDYPPTQHGVEKLLKLFLQPDAKHARLTLPLKPSLSDCQKIFTDRLLAEKACHRYSLDFRQSTIAIHPYHPSQTHIRLWNASTEEIRAWKHPAIENFPKGYQRIGKYLRPGLNIFRWKFVEPGQSMGMAYDGLICLNDRWVWIPKPWSFL